MRRFLISFAAAAVAGLTAGAASAQGYPEKPIKLIVGIGAGSATDVAARLVAKKMSEKLGQQIVVENKPGAAATLAAEATAKAPADGYTLFWGTSSVPMYRIMYNNLRFDPDKDIVPVGAAAQGAMVLLVKNDPKASLADLIARARTKPAAVSYASAGVGSNAHLASEVMGKTIGAQFLHVPYKSSAAGVVDMISGQIDFVIDGLASSLPQIKGGQVKALGVTTTQRSSFLPDVPTLGEAGVSGFSHPIWLGVFTTAGTPKPVIDKLSAALYEVASAPGFRDELAVMGLEPFPIRAAEFAAQVKTESEDWNRKLRGMKLTAD
jgi:tripartite-type tricarboxylate transporter receptor subunit TctC